MTQQAVLREKFRLLKATLRPRFHLMLEDLATSCFKAIDEAELAERDKYEKLYGDILCGKDRYFRTPSMTAGVCYKISSTVENNVPLDAMVMEISETTLAEMKQKNNTNG